MEGSSGTGKTTALKRALADADDSAGAGQVTELSARKPADVERLRGIGSWHTGTVVVDDVHRLDAPLRTMLGDHLNVLADGEEAGRRIVLVGSPRPGRRLVENSHDLTGRVDFFWFKLVTDDAILAMIAKGEDALNVTLERKDDLARAASGSLSVAQLLCFEVCARNGVLRTQATRTVIESGVDEAVAHALVDMGYKFGAVVRAFSGVGGAGERIGVDLLQELAWSKDASIDLEELARSQPALSAGSGASSTST